MAGPGKSCIISCPTCGCRANASARLWAFYRALRVLCLHVIKCTSDRGRQNESTRRYLHCGQGEQICNAAPGELGSISFCTDLVMREVPLEASITNGYCFV